MFSAIHLQVSSASLRKAEPGLFKVITRSLRKAELPGLAQVIRGSPG